jgi:hypothetical protein
MTKHKWEFYDDSGRVCTKCKTYKPYSEFHIHKDCVNGFNTVCKVCRKPISKASYESWSIEYKLWSRALSRSKQRNREFTITLSDIIIPEKCPVFNKPLIYNTEYAPSLDRLDSSKGYTKDNIRVISRRANTLKNNSNIKELESIIKYMKGEI